MNQTQFYLSQLKSFTMKYVFLRETQWILLY